MNNGEQLFDRAYDLASELVDEGEKPFAIAAVFVLVGLQMYRTSMTDEDYNKMVESIFNSRNQVKSLFESEKYKNQLN